MKLKVTAEYLYYYLLILLLLNNWWGDLSVFRGLYEVFKPLVLGSAIVLMVALFFKERYTRVELLLVILLIIAGAYTAYLTGSKWTLYSMILVAFTRNIDIEKTIRVIYKCMSVFITVAICIFVFQFFFIPSSLGVFYDGSYVKYDMTFIGANEAARYWVFWFIAYIYLNMENKIPIIHKILISALTILFYVCTYSDTLLLIPALACLKAFKSCSWFRRIIQKFAGYSFAFFLLFSLVVLSFEGTPFFDILNKFVTGRFALGILGFETYDISLFGQQSLAFYIWIKDAGKRLVLDNAYYMIMIQYGVFYVVLIAFLFYKARKRLDYRSACCLIAYSVFALAANTILSPTAIFPVIIAANLCWKLGKERVFLNEHIKS